MKIEITNDKILVEGESIGKTIQELLIETIKSKVNEKIKEKINNPKEIKNEDATDTEYKYNILTDTSSCTDVGIAKQIDDKYPDEEKNSDDKFEKLDECKEPLNLNRFNTGSVAITMSTLDKPDIDQIADIDKDICGYDRIRVFDSMERKSDITIINDGPDSIYFIVNRNGIDHEEEMWSQAEIMVYPGEAWKVYHVHELRIRSETQGNKYRITEDDIIVGSTIRSVT